VLGHLVTLRRDDLSHLTKRRVASNIAKLPGLLKVKVDAIALASAVAFAASPFEEKRKVQDTKGNPRTRARYWRREPSWWNMIIPVIIIVAAIARHSFGYVAALHDRTVVAFHRLDWFVGFQRNAFSFSLGIGLMFQNAPV
jgi:hypothetical protein